MNEKIPHIPVLYKEVKESFAKVKSGTIIDCTLGYGGHTSLLLNSNPSIDVIGIDQDIEAIEFSSKRLEEFGLRVKIKKGRYSSVIKELLGEDTRGILADIGVSSLQLDKQDRGFSFGSDRLDMRMDQGSSFSASDVINSYSQNDLERVLKEYGEIGNYKNLANEIVKNRPFSSVDELVKKLDKFLYKGKNIHPATLLLQAIRIEVNSELQELESLLDTIENSNLKDCIVAIISFHSLEDRIVKNYFARWAKDCICPDDAMRCSCGKNHSKGKVLTKKPIVAQKDELTQNKRSRSAKMRVFHIK
ncbi:MAG: 16S rRNA (cytosine(1402)-N(4))-methyltransferase RsmH [Sulfurimonas sp.]|jgi:16S rRNA (cytosine1402-N4)-methyltransferase|nr:16S rRNA (cytosine(1402)-N(4))-methyltransferase RsmH [Sulfurimonadaceae bacterium]